MAPEAQALYQQKITEISLTGRFPSLLDFAVARRDAEATVPSKVDPRDPYGFSALLASIRKPANDDAELDALLDTLDEAIPADDEPELTSANDNVKIEIEVQPASAPVPEVVTAAPSSTPAPGVSAVPGLVTNPAPRLRKRKRRSGLRAKEDVRRMRAHAGTSNIEGRRTPTTPSPASLTPSTTSTTKTSTRATTTITTGPTYRRGIASWEDAGELPRIVAINRALAEFGEPFAFSLNVDPKLIRAGNDNARGLLDYLRRRVALELRRALGRPVEMWVVIETEKDGRPHLHGGIAMNDNDTPARIKKAVAKAGGDWTKPGSAPADVRVQHDPDGWAVYPLKRMERTRRDLRKAAGLAPGARVGLLAVTDGLRAAGRRLHEEERQAIGRR